MLAIAPGSCYDARRVHHLLRLLLVLLLSFALGERPQSDPDPCCPDASAAATTGPASAPASAPAQPGCATAGDDDASGCSLVCLATCTCCQPVVAVQGTARAPRFAVQAVRFRLPGAAAPPHIDPEGLLQVPKAA